MVLWNLHRALVEVLPLKCASLELLEIQGTVLLDKCGVTKMNSGNMSPQSVQHRSRRLILYNHDNTDHHWKSGTFEEELSSGDGDLEQINSKIELAMDLVKAHLLLAVHEEVDVLRATITRLLHRIQALQLQNRLLRASLPPETLSRLGLASAASPVSPQPPPPAPHHCHLPRTGGN